MAGYIRQSSFVDGDTITAALFNNEYNQLLNAFNNATGHAHDGTTAEGPVIGLIGDAGETAPNNKVLIDTTNNFVEFYVQVASAPVQQLYIADGAIIPVTDSDIDLGTSSLYFKNAYIDSITTTGNIDVGGNLTVTGTTTFNGGTITMGDAATDNVVFGADIDSNIIPDDDNTYDLGSTSQEWRNLYIDGTANIDSLVADTADINGGTIDGSIIGGTTAAAITGTAITGTSFVIGSADISEAELETIDGVTAGTVAASKAIVVDANKDITGGRNITITGEIDAATLDISGNADIDGTLEADAITIGGITLAETIADTVGAMVSSNTETGIAVSYDDADNTLDFVIGDDAIVQSMIADDAIDSQHYVDGSIDLVHMSINSIDSDQYVDGSIDLVHMSANSVDSDQYVDGSIDLIHMSANSVDSDQYVDGSIDTVHLADDAVTGAKLADNIDIAGTLDVTGILTADSNVVVAGNLTVNGTTTTLNTATLDVEDKNITINYGAGDTSASANGAGITIQDAIDASNDATILWDTTNDEFDFSHAINVAGNIAVSGTVDGRDVATDGTKLDGIEALADVTDATNVTAAGALMDSELTAIASVKALNQGVATTDSPTFVNVTATSLDISGDIDVDGTTNLDVVDIDGALTQDGGAVFNETGADVDFRVESDTVDHALFVQGSDGFVGIGTSSPAAKLQVGWGSDQLQFTNPSAGKKRIGATYTGYVSDNIHASMDLQSAGSSGGDISFNTTPSGGSLTERLRIDEFGSVGIGVVPSSWEATTLDALQLGVGIGVGNLTARVDGINAVGLGLNWYYGGGATNTYVATSFATNYSQEAGTHRWFHAASGTAGDALTFTESMRIDSSGTLLVGTTNTNPHLFTSGKGFAINQGTFGIDAACDNIVGIFNRTDADGTIIEFKKDGTTVGSISSRTGNALIISSAGNTAGLHFGGTEINPVQNGAISDNTIDLGQASYRFDDIYATNGTIQTSDRNEKQDIAELTDAETRVAVAAKGLLRKFRWKSAVEEKGDEARIHFGIIAQDLQDAFTAEGLDAGDYAMFISSTWTDDDGEEQTRLGVRYSELLAFIIAAI
jgi:cytoskeletal protein CcmA (bactofilin family)